MLHGVQGRQGGGKFEGAGASGMERERDEVFDSRHALVPDIKNSEECTAKLMLCESHVLAISEDGQVFRSCGVQKKTVSQTHRHMQLVGSSSVARS